MPKTPHAGRSRWFWTFVLVASLVVPALPVEAQTTQTVQTTTETTSTISPDTLKTRVKVVEVVKSGTAITVNPVKVKLKKKEDVVVWIANGTSLKIEFKKGNPAPGNPFTDLVCKGRFCGALTPPDVVGVFNYKVTVDGVVLDPNVEVVP
jgi:hypothetical protein